MEVRKKKRKKISYINSKAKRESKMERMLNNLENEN